MVSNSVVFAIIGVRVVIPVVFVVGDGVVCCVVNVKNKMLAIIDVFIVFDVVIVGRDVDETVVDVKQ